jgi:nuclear pore complex protein Nup205
VQSARLESLNYERRTLAFAFYYVARAGFLTSSEVKLILDWLDKHPKHDMTLYFLSALFAALDLSYSSPSSESAEQKIAFAKDQATLSFIKRKLAPASNWADSSLKATVLLKWTLLLTEARYRDSTLEHREGFRNEDLEMLVFNAVQGDAFTYLLRVVSQVSAPKNGGSQLLNQLTASTNDSNDARPLVSEEFKPNLLHEVELLLRSLLTQAPAELRKIKHKQEDHFRPRGDRRVSFRPGDGFAERADLPPRNDIATLFQLLGLLYSSLPPNRAIQFWGGFVPSDAPPAPYEVTENERGRLPSFLRWAVEVREPDLIIGVFDMLAGLASGVACAECAYNFMATGTLDVVHGVASLGTGVGGGRYEMSAAFTWGSIFGELESWAALGGTQRGAHGGPPPQLPIAPKDVLLGLSFLRLLAVVVSYSTQARQAIFSHPQYRAIACLVSLIPLGVPLELKGALFETLSAFCQPGAGLVGVDICKTVWTQMERLEVLNVRGVGFASKGVEVELEEVESVYTVYPATMPFLELLATLIHTPKRVSLKSRITEPEPINTIPENLGQPYRIPGISPYTAFVVDNILARLRHREFLNANDQWKMADVALCFLERCLASYELESLPTYATEYNNKGIEALFPLLHHPGFDVLTRILSDTPLRAALITYVVEGSEQLAGQHANPRFANVLLRALRIMDRALDIQDLFLDHLVPVLSEIDSASITGINISTSFLSRVDQGLSLNQKAIPNIGTYVNHIAYPEMIYLAINILSLLSQSPSYQNIATLIERSAESNVILDGFVRLLGVESTHDVAAAEEWTDLWTGAGAPDTNDVELLGQGIRVAILDLLLRGTRRNKASSLAFWLLFGKTTSEEQIQDPHALGARAFCLHIILHLLNTGVPRINGKGKERDRHRTVKNRPLFETQPVLAERLYKLMYQLCEHPRTSSPMMLYLRTREDFFVRHLAVMAVHCPLDERTPAIEMEYGDGSRVVTTCATLKAFLQLRSWLLDLVSLELHILTSKGQHQRIKEILDLLFGTTDTYHEADGDWEHDIFQPFNDVSQSRIRIIEIFQSLEFTWYDSVTVTPVELQFYAQLNLQACVRPDENGCEVVDRNALFQMLTDARRLTMRKGQVATPAQNSQLDAETKYILESCVAENNRREVQFSLNTGYESWKRLLDVVLTKCFSRIAQDQREGILFDLIHVLPPSIRASPLPESCAVLLSEALLLLITKLREERRQLHLLSPSEAINVTTLPAERMLGLLHHIVDCILDRQRQELVRGNLYAALTNYLHLISPQTGDAPKLNSSLSSSSISSDMSLSMSMASSLSLNARNDRGSGTNASLEASSYSVLKRVTDKLVATIAKDAVDGAEVWKTVAFTLLDSLARLSRHDSKHLVISALDRYGLLLNFVHGLRDADESLQAVLRPDPGSHLRNTLLSMI